MITDKGMSMAVRGLTLLLLMGGVLVTSGETGEENLEINQSNKKLPFIPIFSKNITKLILSDNLIVMSSKDIDVLKSYPNLTELYLNGNALTDLPGKLFSSLSELRILNVSSNNISRMEPMCLAGLSNLRELDLSHNLLPSLPQDVFADLHNLETLHLQGNALQTLVNVTFRNMAKLKQLDLENNPWDCSCELLNLIKRIKNSGVSIKGTQATCLLNNLAKCFSGPTTKPPADTEPTTVQTTAHIEPTNTSKVNISSQDFRGSGSGSGSGMPVVGNTWKFLLGVVVIALSTSMLIVCAVKSPTWYKLLFNYRHQRLCEEEEPNVFTTGRYSTFGLDTEQTETSAQELEEGLEVEELDDEDGFIEDRYIEPGDYKYHADSDVQ